MVIAFHKFFHKRILLLIQIAAWVLAGLLKGTGELILENCPPVLLLWVSLYGLITCRRVHMFFVLNSDLKMTKRCLTKL